MLNRVFGKNFHDYFHLFGISALAIGLPTSKVILSLATMLLLLNILLESNYRVYWQNIKSNRLFLILAAYWSLHLIGLLWTSDFGYAANDIRIKITLLVIPLVLTIKPIRSKKDLQLVLLLFVATLILTSLINFASYQHWIGNKIYLDIRELSLFGSHIRYGILIAVGAGISLYYLWSLETAKKWILFPVLIWLCYYTYYSQIISGLLALMVMFFTFFIFLGFIKSTKAGLIVSFSLLLLLLVPIYLLFSSQSKENSIDITTLEKNTPLGNPYTHHLDKNSFENGRPIFAYVNESELKEAWNKSSNLDYDSLDKKDQYLRLTLLRYMTSKGLRKDGTDFLKLTQQDIEFIENGIASTQETKTGFPARLDGIRFQLNNSINPNGHSLLQRLEYWKTGWQIIKQNWIIGVGTGDVQVAFDAQYTKQQSLLLPENRLRAHNSYLTNWISFGIVGLILFLWMNLAFLKTHWKNRNFIPIMFILIALSTFLLEDTLETQMGVSFFAFFFGLYISPIKEKNIS